MASPLAHTGGKPRPAQDNATGTCLDNTVFFTVQMCFDSLYEGHPINLLYVTLKIIELDQSKHDNSKHHNILRKTIERYLDSVPSLIFNTIKTKLYIHAFHNSRYLQSKRMFDLSYASMIKVQYMPK